MPFFVPKSLIFQYEQRILDLKSEISRLAALVLSPTSATRVPLVALEADAILNQKEEPIELTGEERRTLQDELSERDRVLSGNY